MTGFNSKRQMAQDKEALKQEPVAWGFRHDDGAIYDCICPKEHADCEGEYTVPLYATPPQRPWVGLTEAEIDYWLGCNTTKGAVARAIQAALKEKNT
jgi:hypothetical protein